MRSAKRRSSNLRMRPALTPRSGRHAQLQTYMAEIPSLLQYNELLVVPDGLQARIGALTANQEGFNVWRTIDGEGVHPRRRLSWKSSFVVFLKNTHVNRNVVPR